jgi:hypothetical protein
MCLPEIYVHRYRMPFQSLICDEVKTLWMWGEWGGYWVLACFRAHIKLYVLLVSVLIGRIPSAMVDQQKSEKHCHKMIKKGWKPGTLVCILFHRDITQELLNDPCYADEVNCNDFFFFCKWVFFKMDWSIYAMRIDITRPLYMLTLQNSWFRIHFVFVETSHVYYLTHSATDVFEHSF